MFMKIGIIASPYVPVPPIKYGGTELVISNLIKGLKELGHEVVLIGPGDSSIDCKIIPTVKNAISFPKTPKDVPKHEKRVARIEQDTIKLIKQNIKQFDILHSHGFDLLPFKNFPNITTLHSPIIFSNLQYYKKRKILYFASISNNQQGSFPDLKYVGTIYNGENPDKYPFIAQPENYVCFLGRFDEEKNPHLAIQLAINLNMKIKVAGKIDFRGSDYFKEKVQRYFDHPLVEYLGELGFEEKVKLLSHAKCNLHPTGFREPFGLTILEAAYCGTPTLAIARGSMPELIEEGKTGMLVEDFVEGYHQIDECFNMDRGYISQRARLLFNYKTMSKQYEIAYKQVIKQFKYKKNIKSAIKTKTSKIANFFNEPWTDVTGSGNF